MATIELKNKLMQYYDNAPFSIGLHTTSSVQIAQNIMKTGLLTNARALEGTIKFKGDLSSLDDKELNYFFPYTDVTVVIIIPSIFKSEIVRDNKGGNEPLTEFSKFYDFANTYTNIYNDSLPNYYILGYYDKNFNFIENPDNMISNAKSLERFKDDYSKIIERKKRLPTFKKNI